MNSTSFYALLISILIFISPLASAEKKALWISGKDGLFRAFLHSDTGKLTQLELIKKSKKSIRYGHFIALHPSKDILYALASNQNGSEIHAFSISDNNELQLLNKLKKLPKGSAHIEINPQATTLAVSYYGSANIGLYALKDSGELSHIIHEEKVSGSSVDPRRQTRPHPHGSVFSHEGNIAYFSDLGTDFIWAYQVKDNKQAQLLHKIKSPAGFGPRHIIFDKNYNFAYMTQELVGGVSVMKNNKQNGTLEFIQHQGQANQAALEEWANVSDLQIHPSGKFLFVVNRGFDQITSYGINQETGKLTFIANEPLRGSMARHITISEDGKWLITAATSSGTVASFKINDDGRLRYTRSVFSITEPKAVFINE